jgi:hypothetical protein
MKRRFTALFLVITMMLSVITLPVTAFISLDLPDTIRAMCPGHENEEEEGYCLFCTKFHFLGDVDGSGSINVLDAIEILKYLARLESNILVTFAGRAYTVTNPQAYAAADVNQDGVIDFLDVAEILALLSGFRQGILLTGEPIGNHTFPMTAEFRCVEGVGTATHITFVTDVDLEPNISILDYTVTVPEGITRIRGTIENTDIDVSVYSDSHYSRSNYFQTILTIHKPIPAGSVLFTQQIDGRAPLLSGFSVEGENISTRIVTCETEGCCGNPVTPTIYDALEILKQLAGLRNTAPLNSTINDALAILKIVIGI